MKIIDILNKINNNEEVPEKVKYEDTIFEYNKEQKDYMHKKDKDGWVSETLLFEVMDTHFISELLREEIEAIEENKEIEELGFIEETVEYCDGTGYTNTEPASAIDMHKKINELVRAVNKLNKEREEK